MEKNLPNKMKWEKINLNLQEYDSNLIEKSAKKIM
jgi:hypothetical protein